MDMRKMKLTPANERITAMGNWYCRLPENYYCPFCRKEHDEPKNFIEISQRGQMGIGCRLRPGHFYPDPIATVAPETVNILFPLFSSVETVFPEDPELNRALFASLRASDVDLAKFFHFLGRDRFEFSAATDEWWALFEGERWINCKRLVEDFCRSTMADKYVWLQRFYNERTEDGHLRARRSLTIDSIVRRLRGAERALMLHEAEVFFTKQHHTTLRFETRQALADATEKALLSIAKRGKKYVYLGDLGVINGEHLIKGGSTDDAPARVPALKRTFPNGFFLFHLMEHNDNRELERQFKNHPDVRGHQRDVTHNGNTLTECFRVDDRMPLMRYKKILTTLARGIVAQEMSFQHEERMRELELEVEKQKTRRMEIELEVMRMRADGCSGDHPRC